MNTTNTTNTTTKFTVGYIPFYTEVAIKEAHYDETGEAIKYHTPTGLYDIELVQFFESVRDRILYKGAANSGLCAEIYMGVTVHRHRRFEAENIIKKYMPHKYIGEYWWPNWYDPTSESCEVEQAFHDRVAFLNRIIEDLMCGV